MNGSNWQTIGKQAAAGYSNRLLTYQFIDTHPVAGLSYYRLRPTDLDGQFTYSTIVLVRYHTGIETAISVYPNPVAYQFTIALNGPQPAIRLRVRLVNAAGQLVSDKENLTGNSQTFNIVHLASGRYYLVIDNNGERSANVEMWK